MLVSAVLSHSVMSDSAMPQTVSRQAPLSMGVLQARTGVGAMPSSKDLPNPGIEHTSSEL